MHKTERFKTNDGDRTRTAAARRQTINRRAARALKVGSR